MTRLLATALAFACTVLLGAVPAHAETAMRVAVLEFSNASSEAGLEALGKGLQSMITTDLARVSALTVVERSRLQEIVAEQKLGNSGLVDKATAAKIGKLAGASHLLGGTFTIVAKTMRLDARLFSVKTGEVMLAEDMAGERDAFFELEKSLVNKMIATLGVKLEPKERAGISKIHTADFGAFKNFSQGVAHFDQQRYDDAFESLRAAMKLDADFNLARVTLDEYEAVVAKIRAKAQSIEISSRKLDQAKKDQDFDNDSQVAERLVAVASEPGQAAVHRRLAALAYLMEFYDHHGRNHGRISRFQDHFDGLVVRRRLDTLARRYFTEAQPVFPNAPLFSTGQHPPDKPDDVEKRIAGLAESFKMGGSHRADLRNQSLVNNLRQHEGFLQAMAADRRETIKILELVAAKLGPLGADEYARTDVLRKLAEAYLDVGDVDAASGALTRASAIESDPSDLKNLATRVEELGKISALFARTDKKAELRELVAGNERHPGTLEKLVGTPGPPSPKLLSELAERREVKRWWPYGDPFWLWNGEPAHLLQGEYVLFTAARTDGIAARDLRYYRAPRMSTKDVLLALGRGPRGDFEATFELSYTKAPDFMLRYVPREVVTAADFKTEGGRPEFTFVFGLHDVDTHNQQDPETRKTFWPEPTQGYGVRLTSAAVALVKVGEPAPAAELRKSEMTIQVISESGKGVGDDTVKVKITVKGKSVSVQVGGASHSFKLPEDPNGFSGVHLRGEGYVQIGDLRVK